MWLVEWLLLRYNYVLDWFSANYITWRERIRSLPSVLQSIINFINAQISSVVNAIYSAINSFWHNIVDPIRISLQNTIQAAINFIYNLRNDVLVWIEGARNFAEGLFNSLRNWIMNTLPQWSETIKHAIFGLVLGYFANIIAGYHQLINFLNWITQSAQLLNIEKIREILNFYNAVKQTLITFTQNPIAFILDLLWNYFIIFVDAALGYALGSVKYPLPPKPNWNKK